MIVADSDEDFRRQWLEWTGKEHHVGDDYGIHTVLVFAGTGYAVFKLDPKEQDSKLVAQIEKELTAEIMEGLSGPDPIGEIMKELPASKKYMQEHSELRKPSLPPESD